MANITSLIYDNQFNPSNTCFEWCKEQYINNEINTTIEGLTILVIAMIALFIYTAYLSFGDMIETTYEGKVTLEKYIQLLPNFALYLIIGFFIWFIWFS